VWIGKGARGTDPAPSGPFRASSVAGSGFIIGLTTFGPGPRFGVGGSVPVDKGRRYFTVGETAEHLGLSRPKVYQMVGRRELRSLKIGGVARIPREEIERLERGSRA
jgi:excisionase family DNA binding protein